MDRRVTCSIWEPGGASRASGQARSFTQQETTQMPDTLELQNSLRGQALLDDPARSKGTAFTIEERRK